MARADAGSRLEAWDADQSVPRCREANRSDVRDSRASRPGSRSGASGKVHCRRPKCAEGSRSDVSALPAVVLGCGWAALGMARFHRPKSQGASRLDARDSRVIHHLRRCHRRAGCELVELGTAHFRLPKSQAAIRHHHPTERSLLETAACYFPSLVDVQSRQSLTYSDRGSVAIALVRGARSARRLHCKRDGRCAVHSKNIVVRVLAASSKR